MTDTRYDDIRIRNQAIRACTLCDPAGYLPTGHLCSHDEPASSEARTAAKARAREAVDQARQKSAWQPAPAQSERRVQEPEPEETPRMSYDPVAETTRGDVVGMIASDLARRGWGERDWDDMAEQILQRIERQARGETDDEADPDPA